MVVAAHVQQGVSVLFFLCVVCVHNTRPPPGVACSTTRLGDLFVWREWFVNRHTTYASTNANEDDDDGAHKTQIELRTVQSKTHTHAD